MVRSNVPKKRQTTVPVWAIEFCPVRKSLFPSEQIESYTAESVRNSFAQQNINNLLLFSDDFCGTDRPVSLSIVYRLYVCEQHKSTEDAANLYQYSFLETLFHRL